MKKMIDMTVGAVMGGVAISEVNKLDIPVGLKTATGTTIGYGLIKKAGKNAGIKL